MAGNVGLAAALAAGYAVGTLPTADLAARLAGADREAVYRYGTGNPGGLNASHVLGRGWGATVSAVDVAKGTAAAAIGRRLAGERGANLAATAAVLGHCHPPGRPGGKGVATSVGQVVGTFPAYLPIDLTVGSVAAMLPWPRRRTETATAIASVTWVACGFAWWKRGWSCGLGRPTSLAVPVAALASSLVIRSRFRREAHRVDDHDLRVASQP